MEELLLKLAALESEMAALKRRLAILEEDVKSLKRENARLGNEVQRARTVGREGEKGNPKMTNT
jgi:predicted  nucleic acid-binding Zn-ribbon protein